MTQPGMHPARKTPPAPTLQASARLALQLARRPGLAAAVLRSRVSGRPAIVFYCQQAGHRQTAHEVIRALQNSQPSRHDLVVLNSFPRAKLPPEVRLSGVREFAAVPLPLIRFFRAAAVFTPMVAFPRDYLGADVPVVHLMISLASLDGVYDEGHFDGYDYVACAGPHQLTAFQEWRKRRPQLGGKILIPAGYPKLDLQRSEPVGDPAPDFTVVYAPTHVYAVNEQLASLRRSGAGIVRGLLAEGWRVIFRPHPESLRDSDAGLVGRIVDEHRQNPRFTLDRSSSYAASYAASSLMVTDLSGTGFTYAFTYGRPAVFFAADADTEASLKGLQFEARERIGGVARNIPDLVATVRNLAGRRDECRRQIESFRAETIFNVGSSGNYLAAHIERIVRRECRDDWMRL